MHLVGEGEYNLNVLKEIKVTESYLGLDSVVTGCQTKESFDNCTTRMYRQTFIDQCKCLPFDIRLSNEVTHLLFENYDYGYMMFSSDTSLHCQPNGMCKHCKHFIWLPAPMFWIYPHKFLKINQWEKPPQYFVKRNWCLQKVYQVVSISIRFKRLWCSLFKVVMSLTLIFFRVWMGEQAKICKNLLWYSNIWQNHQGQSSKVCGHAVSNWRHHGTSHWVFNY